MSARVVKIAFLLAAVAAALALAPSASAAVAPGAGSDPSASAGDCVGPCPSVLVFKGRGGGSVTSQPVGVAQCTSPFLCTFEPDNEQHGATLRLRAQPANGSYLAQWQCPSVGGRVEGNECVLDLTIQGATYTVCVVFEPQGTPPGPSTSCPPPTALPPPAPPPPPPPSNPPRPGSRCTIPGTAGPNVINGTRGRDVICGRGGNDRINGRGGHDLILGGSGRDRLTGGSGRDAIYGNSGNDTLSARDGTRDTVNGGRGRDRARWDARDVRRSIERRL